MATESCSVSKNLERQKMQKIKVFNRKRHTVLKKHRRQQFATPSLEDRAQRNQGRNEKSTKRRRNSSGVVLDVDSPVFPIPSREAFETCSKGVHRKILGALEGRSV